MKAGSGANVRLPQDRIENPDIGNTEGQIVVDTFLHIAQPVVFGKNLDADQRGLSEHWLNSLNPAHDANVRNAKAMGAYAQALFNYDPNLPFALANPKPGRQAGL